ncbi:MAG: CoA-acylating methylmalonate-semialdehyde dehydrogenase [Solirubrobacterales bacterium]
MSMMEPQAATAESTRASANGADSDARILRNFIGSQWVEAAAGETLEDRNPATGELLAHVPLSSAADVDAAVSAAREAQAEWGATPPQRRARAVISLRNALWDAREELARLVTTDMGKTLDDASGEVGRGIESTEAACGIPTLMKGDNLEGIATSMDVEEWRQPVGVVAAITPFNFPAMIPLWFLPFALATGNSIVLKPSERDPLTSERIFELIESIDELPPGVANLVHGAHDSVNALLDHPEVDAISFVGQASTAKYVVERAAPSGKRVQALGGAKNSMVVMPDAKLDDAMPAMMASAFGNAGQRCLAGSVAVIVGDEERRAEVREALKDAASSVIVGPGDGEDVLCPPMVGADARERVAGAVERALDGGAELILDGRGTGNDAGCLMGPTLIATDDRDSELTQEELFGPVLAVVDAPDFGDAIGFVNSSRYGNASSIFTTSGAAARRYRAECEAGMIGVNVGVPAPVAWFPFAGWKDSFLGDLHANGRDAVLFYTRAKVVTSRWT